MGDLLNMGSRSTQLASAEILMVSAVDMTTDAATILIDAGEEESAQEVKTCAAFGEETLERLRQKRIAAEAAEASGAAEANNDKN
jgi:hypothetical protein